MLCNMLPKSRAAGCLAGEGESCVSVPQPAAKTDCRTQTCREIYREVMKSFQSDFQAESFATDSLPEALSLLCHLIHVTFFIFGNPTSLTFSEAESNQWNPTATR